MGLPLNVERNRVGQDMVLSTPFHSAVVEWAHQHDGRWDKERRAWVVQWSQGAAESFDALCAAIWPSGVATAERRSGPRRAYVRASEASTRARCTHCHGTGFEPSPAPSPVSREPAPVSQEPDKRAALRAALSGQ